MALERSAKAGTEVLLRARMRDDVGLAAQASGVIVNIFTPDADVTDPLEAIETGTPTYWTDGIFEYTYPIPGDAVEGLWKDIWTGTLDGQTLSGIFQFEVYAAGNILPLTSQLSSNEEIDIILASGIAALDGSVLEEPYEFSFLTTISPAYTDGNKVRLEVGAALPGIKDDTLYTAILEASIEADQLNFRKTRQNTNFFEHVRREWVTCKAASVLATNVAAQNNLKSKQLGDLHVDYDPKALNDLLNRISSCLNRWEPELNAGGFAVQTPEWFIKGENDPDRPQVGRTWRTDEHGSYLSRRILPVPAGNHKDRNPHQRRWKKDFRPKY
jgi:hypothetical protein